MFRSSKEVEDIIKTIKNPESELISLETKNLCIEKIEVDFIKIKN